MSRFTTAVSNSFLSPLTNPIAADLGYFRVIFILYRKWYILCTHYNRLDEAILMKTHNITFMLKN